MKYAQEFRTVLRLYKDLGIKLDINKPHRAFGFFNLRSHKVSIDTRALKRTKTSSLAILDLIYILLHELGHAMDLQTQRYKSFFLPKNMTEDEMEVYARELAPAELSADLFAKSIMKKLKLPTKRCYYLHELKKRGRVGFKIMVLRSYGIFAVRVR